MNEEYWNDPVCLAFEKQVDALMCQLKPRGKNVVDCSMQTLVSHDIRDHEKTWVERHAICSKCGNEEWQKGDTIGCAKSALIKLKYTCPRGENNFYFSTPLLREEAEERALALANKDKRRIR